MLSFSTCALSFLLHPVSCIHICPPSLCVYVCVFSLSLFSFLFQGKDIARFYDITCHMTLQHVCSVCMHYSHVFVCVYVFLCMSVRVCLSVQPLAAIAGTGSCASLCAKYIWSVSYFEFKLKNFLASFASALLCCVCERQMPYTHTGHTMYVYVCMCGCACCFAK